MTRISTSRSTVAPQYPRQGPPGRSVRAWRGAKQFCVVAAIGLAMAACGSDATDSDGAETTVAEEGSEATATSLPATGPGWDEEFVYIGIMTMKDAEQAAAASGSPVYVGDQEADAQAIVAALNREGGLFGRQIQLVVHDNVMARAQSDPDGVGQENCTAFTQDRSVIAVLALPAPADRDALRACLAEASTLQFSIGNAVWDDEIGERYAPFFYHAGYPSLTRLVPLLMSRLEEQEYFTPWDTSIGGPSDAAPVRVGVLHGNDETGRRQSEALASAIEEAGHAVETFETAAPTDFAAAVLRFKADGVTHVTGPAGFGMAQFLMAAKAQEYYPRLGVDSYMVPWVALQEIAAATPQQLNGAVGVGWREHVDVRTAQDPGSDPGAEWCLDALAAGGQTFENSDGDRFAQGVALAICDSILLPVRGAEAGGGLDPTAIRTGILSIGDEYETASTGFGTNGISESNFGLPGAARDLSYDSTCECFEYVGDTYPL